VRIRFEVGGTPVEFRRSVLTGRAELRLPSGTVLLQSPLDLATHFSTGLVRVWTYRTEGHEVVVEKTRPLFFSAFRPHDYRVLVDGAVVAQARGY
jgi:hypothetical protein